MQQIDNEIQNIVNRAFNVYRNCFYFYFKAERYKPIVAEIRFYCCFKSQNIKVGEPYKNDFKKLINTYTLCEQELIDLDIWLVMNLKKEFLMFIIDKIDRMIQGVEQHADSLKGFQFDREITELFVNRHRAYIYKTK